MAEESLHILLLAPAIEDAHKLEGLLTEVADMPVELAWHSQLGTALVSLESKGYDTILVVCRHDSIDDLAAKIDSFGGADCPLPIIALCDLDDDGHGIEAVRLGVQDVLHWSTLNGQQLLRAIHYAMARHRRILRVLRPAANEGENLTPTAVNRRLQPCIPGFRLVDRLGKGDLTTVYLATPTNGNSEQRAVKVLPLDHLHDRLHEGWKRRFLRESKVTAALRHPHVVRVFDVGISPSPEYLYIVMEYVAGRSLAQCVAEQQPWTTEEKVALIRQVADALVAIHAQNICHRDIKPSNIMIDANREAKLTDFGLARWISEGESTDTSVLGSPAYMAPESFHSSYLDVRSDLFSLGIVAYEWLAGRRPFSATMMGPLIEQIQNQRPAAPRSLNPDIPRPLQNILARMLKKNPAERHGSAAELVEELDEYLAGKHPRRKSLLATVKTSLRQKDWD